MLTRAGLGEEHPNTAGRYMSLARILNRQGKHAEAALVGERALDIDRRMLGEIHGTTAIAYSSLALTLHYQGQNADAEMLYRKALEIDLKVWGPRHPNVANKYRNLASVLLSLGKNEEAESLFRRSLDIDCEIYGKESSSTVIGYNGLAVALGRQGKLAEEEPISRKALAITRKLHGDKNPSTIRCRNNLARTLAALGKYAEAEEQAVASARDFSEIRLRAGFSGLDRATFSADLSPLPFLALLQARLGKSAEAWQSLEQDLARGLLDDLSARNTRPLSPQDKQREQKLFGKVAELSQRIELLLGRKNIRSEQREEAEKLGRERDQAQAELAAPGGPASEIWRGPWPGLRPVPHPGRAAAASRPDCLARSPGKPQGGRSQRRALGLPRGQDGAPGLDQAGRQRGWWAMDRGGWVIARAQSGGPCAAEGNSAVAWNRRPIP